MSRKHFVRMAAEFKALIEGSDCPEFINGVVAAVGAFCELAHGCNGNFDEDRFRRACGL